MKDSRPDGLPARQTASAETFANFLQQFHADTETAGREYARLRRKLLGFFEMRGDHDPPTAADETLDRAALKLAEGKAVPDIGRYCLGIARLVTLERYRQSQREKNSFLGFAKNQENKFDEQLEQAYRLMARCLEQLPAREQELLTAYCQELQGQERARRRLKLAEEWETTTMGLRLRVHRLRLRLSECVKKAQNK